MPMRKCFCWPYGNAMPKMPCFEWIQFCNPWDWHGGNIKIGRLFISDKRKCRQIQNAQWLLECFNIPLLRCSIGYKSIQKRKRGNWLRKFCFIAMGLLLAIRQQSSENSIVSAIPSILADGRCYWNYNFIERAVKWQLMNLRKKDNKPRNRNRKPRNQTSTKRPTR